MIRSMFVFLLVLLFPLSSIAQDDRFSKEFTICMDKADATFDMIDCITVEFIKQKDIVTSVYDELKSSISSDDDRESLKESQQAWEKYVDSFSSFRSSPDFGTSGRLDANYWLLEATAARAKELRAVIP